MAVAQTIGQPQRVSDGHPTRRKPAERACEASDSALPAAGALARRGDDGIGVETGELGSVFLFVLPPARIGNKIGKPPSVPYLHSPEADTEGEIHVAGAALDGDVPVAERFSDLVWPDAS